MSYESYIHITGKLVHRIGIGTARIGGGKDKEGKFFPVYGNERREKSILTFSVFHGQNHIDTAPVYGSGYTEEVIGQALADMLFHGIPRRGLFITTKVGFESVTRREVGNSIRDSLTRLRITQADLVYLHQHPKTGTADRMIYGICDAFNQELTTAIGVSNFNLEQLRRVVKISGVPISAYQARYNLFSRGLVTPDLISFCRDQGIVIVAHTPLGRGAIPNTKDNPLLSELSVKYYATYSQIALSWLMAQDDVVAIPRAHKEEHIIENLESLKIKLDREDIKKLDSLA